MENQSKKKEVELPRFKPFRTMQQLAYERQQYFERHPYVSGVSCTVPDLSESITDLLSHPNLPYKNVPPQGGTCNPDDPDFKPEDHVLPLDLDWADAHNMLEELKDVYTDELKLMKAKQANDDKLAAQKIAEQQKLHDEIQEFMKQHKSI